MFSLHRLESLTVVLVLALLCSNLAYKLANFTLLYHLPVSEPVNGGIWNVERKPIAFQFDSGLHYGLNASTAWGALVPGDGLIHLGPHREPFMPSMFHQLRCLDIMREQLTRPRTQREEQPARHCMNYIRQMILCRGDTHLDPYQYPSNVRPVDANPIRRCVDWRAVYEAVEENQREYAEWAAAGRVTGEL